MVVLGGGLFLMSAVPLHCHVSIGDMEDQDGRQ